MTKNETIIAWLLIIGGIALRFVDMFVFDIKSDEAQFITGESNAQPPFALAFIRFVMLIFGPTNLTARLLSAFVGVASLGLVYILARQIDTLRTNALWIVAIMSIVPSHILFSRLSYLDVFLFATWLIVLILFYRARKHTTGINILLLYLACLLCIFTKAQGFIFVGLLSVGRLIEQRGRIVRDPIFWAMGISIIPIFFYLAAYPKIIATSIGVSSGAGRFEVSSNLFFEMVHSWWRYTRFYIVLAVASIPFIRRLPWPLWALIGTGLLINYVLGAGSKYYTLYLASFAFSITALLMWLKPMWRYAIVVLLAVSTFSVVGPRSIIPPEYLASPLQIVGYWNKTTPTINAVLAEHGATEILSLPAPGHHYRWHIDAEVIPGDGFDISDYYGFYLIETKFDHLIPEISNTEIIYEDEKYRILHRTR